MNAPIQGLRDQFQILLALVFGAALLILPVVVSRLLLRSKGYSRGWLVLAIVPVVGWLLVCVLLLLPRHAQPGEEAFEPQPAVVPWGGLSGIFLILALLTGFSKLLPLRQPQPPGLNEGEVRSAILKVVESLEQSERSRNFGQPEIAQIDELRSDEASGERAGRVIVKHNLGRDVYQVKLSRADGDRGLWQVEVMRDKTESLAPNSWRVREVLHEELAHSPHVRNLGLSTAQLAALPVTETSPDPTQPDPTQPDPTQPDPMQPDPMQPDPMQPDPMQMVRQGEVRLPAGAGEPSRVVKFLVHWCDIAESCAGIQLIEGELPTAESVSFQHELKHAVEDWPQFRENREAYGRPSWTQIEQVLFDAEQQQRFYRVQVRHAQGELQLSVVHQWKNREQGLWEVKILEH